MGCIMTRLEYEQHCWQSNGLLLGIDEAGRGPLAGELVVCGVILHPHNIHPDLNDSKKLSEKKRELLYKWIMDNAQCVCIEIVNVETIDQLNIYQATKQAMIKIKQQCPQATSVITDAMPLDDEHVLAIVKADQKSMSVAAASIVAKVVRDHRMLELDQLYPNYGFKQHKGYPTKAHYQAIAQYGITPYHRTSFRLFKNE